MITTVTLNPAIDKVYQMTAPIEGGTVMRVGSVVNSAGGKGINVARVAMRCGEDTIALGFLGGYNGLFLEDMLTKDGVNHLFTHTQAETRSSIKVLDERFLSTELIEPGLPVTDEETESFIDSFTEHIKESKVVVLSGSVPKGISADIYLRLTEIATSMGKKVIADTSGKLLENVISGRPFMIKPNLEELETLFNVKINSLDEIVPYARKLHEDGIDYVVVSLGKDGAFLVCDEGVFHGIPPKVEVINTVGCGDSMVAGFAVSLSRGYGICDTLRYAISVATANALEAKTGDINPENINSISENVKIVKIS